MGSDDCPDPRMLVASAVTVMFVEGWQNEDDTSNKCSQPPS